MKKRILALLLSLVLLIGLLPVGAQALSGTLYNMEWSFSNGVLTVGGTERISIDKYNTPWWKEKFHDDVRTVIVEEGVTFLGEGLFQTLENVEKLYLPSTIDYIRYYLFWDFYYEPGEMHIYYNGSPSNWNSVSKWDNDWLDNAVIHYYNGNTFPVTLDPMGGTMATFNRSLEYGDLFGPLPTPTREGYGFEGWYTRPEYGDQVTEDTVFKKGSPITLYAHWGDGIPHDDDHLQNFDPEIPYTPGQFTDVSQSDWFAANVQRAYEFGLMNGVDETSFNPKGNLTVAQVVTIAARLHNTYFGGGHEFVQGDPWYKTYTDYAEYYHLVQAGTNYEAICSRASFAGILASALPDKEFAEINQVARIPDVHKVDWFSRAVYQFYNAGILQGNDSHGVFAPASSITRAETAAILSRIVDKSQRVSFTLDTTPYDLENPTERTVFYGPNGQSIRVVHADKVSPTGKYGYYENLYSGYISGSPSLKTEWDTATFRYGTETDLYKAYFYVEGRERIVEVWINTLTGEQNVWYRYDLLSSYGDFVGICLENVFDGSDQLYFYHSAYSYAPSFSKMVPASVYDE